MTIELHGQPAWGHDICSTFLTFLIKNVTINKQIKIISYLQPEIRKIMQTWVQPWLSRSYNVEINVFNICYSSTITGFLDPEQIFF